MSSFISPVLSSVSYEVEHSFSTFGVTRNDIVFQKIFKTVIQKFAIQHMMNIICSLVTRTSVGFRLNSLQWPNDRVPVT